MFLTKLFFIMNTLKTKRKRNTILKRNVSRYHKMNENKENNIQLKEKKQIPVQILKERKILQSKENY